jgi:hypothetical protein
MNIRMYHHFLNKIKSKTRVTTIITTTMTAITFAAIEVIVILHISFLGNGSVQPCPTLNFLFAID